MGSLSRGYGITGVMQGLFGASLSGERVCQTGVDETRKAHRLSDIVAVYLPDSPLYVALSIEIILCQQSSDSCLSLPVAGLSQFNRARYRFLSPFLIAVPHADYD